jgi:hypothetical protein
VLAERYPGMALRGRPDDELEPVGELEDQGEEVERDVAVAR